MPKIPNKSWKEQPVFDIFTESNRESVKTSLDNKFSGSENKSENRRWTVKHELDQGCCQNERDDREA